MSKIKTEKIIKKQPVIAVLGHVDHGKSTLLDYIRKTNIVDNEAGGITQHISAYEFSHKMPDGKILNITFLDTPGHEAFQNMRERGVEISDIAVLVVSAEDGVKTQTLEAWKAITEMKIPFVVAINKIDKPSADIQKTINSLIENGIYLEGYGGDVPYVEISAKTGTGVNELIETLLLMSDLYELKTNLNINATGKVLECFVDNKRGISVTLIIKDGVMPNSGAILAGSSLSPIRIVEDFKGKPIKNAIAGQPIKVTGFDSIPNVGAIFISSNNKKELEELQKQAKENEAKNIIDPKIYRNAKVLIPVMLKADTYGTLEAIKKELKKKETNEVKIKFIYEGIGNITEGDILQASADEKVVILGFNIKIENKAKEQAERFNIKPEIFDIIYKLTERFEEIYDERLPFIEKEKTLGKLKILKIFNINKDKTVIGGKVTEGVIIDKKKVKIYRRDYEIGTGQILELQSMKIKTNEIKEGNECGILIQTKTEMIPGDILVASEIEKIKL